MLLSSFSSYTPNYNLSMVVQGVYFSLLSANTLTFSINSSTIYDHFKRASLEVIPLKAFYTTGGGSPLITELGLTLIHKNKVENLILWNNGELLNSTTILSGGLYTVNVSFQIPQRNLIYQPIYLNITSLVVISPTTGVYYYYYWMINVSLTGFVFSPIPPLPPSGAIPNVPFTNPFVNGNYSEEAPLTSSPYFTYVPTSGFPQEILEIAEELYQP